MSEERKGREEGKEEKIRKILEGGQTGGQGSATIKIPSRLFFFVGSLFHFFVRTCGGGRREG